jgi:hypothetical protein
MDVISELFVRRNIPFCGLLSILLQLDLMGSKSNKYKGYIHLSTCEGWPHSVLLIDESPALVLRKVM